MPRIASPVITAVLCSCALQLSGQGSIRADELRWKPADVGSTPDIDPQVHLVLTGGCWQRAEAQGRYRLIVIEGGFEEVFHLGYVQVMAADLERGRETVVKTTPIAEAGDGQYLVTLRNVTLARSDPLQCSDAVFEGEIVRRTHERLVSEQRFRLQVHPDGTYAWSEKPIPAHPSAARVKRSRARERSETEKPVPARPSGARGSGKKQSGSED